MGLGLRFLYGKTACGARQFSWFGFTVRFTRISSEPIAAVTECVCVQSLHPQVWLCAFRTLPACLVILKPRISTFHSDDKPRASSTSFLMPSSRAMFARLTLDKYFSMILQSLESRKPAARKSRRAARAASWRLWATCDQGRGLREGNALMSNEILT